MSTVDCLDNPIWTALNTAQSHLALGDDLARRYPPDIEPFAATRDASAAALTALADLVQGEDKLLLIQREPIVVGPGLIRLDHRLGVQMIADPARIPPVVDFPPLRLGDADVLEMMALAHLTRPGPFLPRTHTLGQFWGVRDGGRLVAMAGERMKQPGFTEASGVCTHPDARGRGLARRLSAFVAARIAARGETPYLHAYADNDAALALYDSLGFSVRCEMDVGILART